MSLRVFFGFTPAGIIGIFITDIGITSALCLNSFYEHLGTVTRRRQKYIQWFILGNFLDVLIEINNHGKIRDNRERARWMGTLEETAFAIEHFLARQFNTSDSAIREWISVRAREAALIVRLMACNIAVSSEGTWEKLRSDLRKSVAAIAAGNLGALPEPESTLPRNRISRRRRVVMNLVRAAVAFILLATLIGVLVAFKSQTTIQLASTAVITALIPVVIGVLMGTTNEGNGGSDMASDNE
jgi:hypothetical protein